MKNLDSPPVPLKLTDLTPHTQLTANQVANLLTEAGYPTTLRALRRLEATNSGPLYSTEPRYRWRNAMKWAIERRGKKHRRAAHVDIAKHA